VSLYAPATLYVSASGTQSTPLRLRQQQQQDVCVPTADTYISGHWTAALVRVSTSGTQSTPLRLHQQEQQYVCVPTADT